MKSLKEAYKNYFLVGAAVNTKTIKTHEKLITTHFNSITCENEMKYSSICKNGKDYDFTNADIIFEFAKLHNLKLRGHTLVWHNQTPDEIFENGAKESLLATLKTHMMKIYEHYGQNIYCWDVVNEAISDDKTDGALRKTKWLDIIGQNYMDDVFNMSSSIFNNISLFYNDYNETGETKRIRIFNTLKDMLDRGVNVNGIGMQCHWNIYNPSIDQVKESIELYAKLGIPIHITEMDISLFEFSDKSKIDKPSDLLFEKQADLYGKAFELFREYSNIIDCVTLWGVADDATWLDNFPVKNRKNWPLLFDENHNPKLALMKIIDF